MGVWSQLLLNGKDTPTEELHLAELFLRHAGGTLFLGHHPETLDDPPAFIVSFIGADGTRRDLSRSKITRTIAALVGKEVKKRCRQCKLIKGIDCFTKRRPGLCLMCSNDNQTKKRKTQLRLVRKNAKAIR